MDVCSAHAMHAPRAQATRTPRCVQSVRRGTAGLAQERFGTADSLRFIWLQNQLALLHSDCGSHERQLVLLQKLHLSFLTSAQRLLRAVHYHETLAQFMSKLGVLYP